MNYSEIEYNKIRHNRLSHVNGRRDYFQKQSFSNNLDSITRRKIIYLKGVFITGLE